jgi:hypothetical protein
MAVARHHWMNHDLHGDWANKFGWNDSLIVTDINGAIHHDLCGVNDERQNERTINFDAKVLVRMGNVDVVPTGK